MAKDKPPPAHTRTLEELRAEMTEQLKALGSLAKQFSQGEQWAAKLMATIIYVICHDGRDVRTRSLLTQLDARDRLVCIDTALQPEPGNLVTLPLMMLFRFGEGHAGQYPRFLEKGQSEFPWRPFEEWWGGAVYSTGTENIITRKELVLAVRSKDGGGHFDSELSCANYVNMKAGSGWKSIVGDVELPPDPSHLLTIWSVGWELVTSVNEHQRRLRSQPTGA